MASLIGLGLVASEPKSEAACYKHGRLTYFHDGMVALSDNIRVTAVPAETLGARRDYSGLHFFSLYAKALLCNPQG
jgi:hypothetical protein